jgi:SNF family Na+-dependent transporter
VYPSALQFLGHNTGRFMSILWFATITLLGIDTQFAMVEAVATIIEDFPRIAGAKREMVSGWLCMFGFLCSLVYVSDIGVYLFDVVDHNTTGYMLMLIAALEAFTIGWVWALPELQSRVGTRCAASHHWSCFSEVHI